MHPHLGCTLLRSLRPRQLANLLKLDGEKEPEVKSAGLLNGPVEQWVDELAALTLEYGIDTYILAENDLTQVRRFVAEVIPQVREQVARYRSQRENQPGKGGVTIRSDDDKPDIMQLAKQAHARDEGIVERLFTYQDDLQLTDEQLAASVGVPVDQLTHLASCQMPMTQGDITTIAHHVHADVRKLTAWFRVWLYDYYRELQP